MLSKAICWRKGNLLSCPICSRPKNGDIASGKMNVSITCMGSATLKLCPFCCHISFSMNILLEKGRVPSATPVDWFLTLGDIQAVSLPQMEVHSIVFGHGSDYATPELPSLYAKPFDRFVQIATSWCESVEHYELVF